MPVSTLWRPTSFQRSSLRRTIIISSGIISVSISSNNIISITIINITSDFKWYFQDPQDHRCEFPKPLAFIWIYHYFQVLSFSRIFLAAPCLSKGPLLVAETKGMKGASRQLPMISPRAAPFTIIYSMRCLAVTVRLYKHRPEPGYSL